MEVAEIFPRKRQLKACSTPHRFVGRNLNGYGAFSDLTDREMHIFSLIGAGHGIGRIANTLGISRKTVETYCERIKLKLGYANAEALKRGARHFLTAA